MIRIQLALVALAATGLAQTGPSAIEWWHEEWDAALEEAARRNVPVLVSFIQDGEEANERIVMGLFKDPAFIKATRKVVPIIASIKIHKPMEQVIRGKARSVCSRFGSVKCSVHKRQEMEARHTCWPKGLVKTPSHVVLLPDGTEVDRLIDVHGTDAYTDLMKRAQRKLGRGLSAVHYAQARRLLAEGRSSLAGSRIGTAMARVAELEKLVRDTPLAKNAEALREAVEGVGRKAVSDATRLAGEGRHVEALRLLSGSIQAFKGTPLSRELKKAQARLKASKEGRAAARVLRNEERARPSWEKASKHEKEKDYVRAVKAYYRVIGLAPDAPLGKEARARVDTLRKDPDLVKILKGVVAEQEAGLLYKEASRLRRSKRKQEANAMLRRIVAEWPGTSTAAKAKKLLGSDG